MRNFPIFPKERCRIAWASISKRMPVDAETDARRTSNGRLPVQNLPPPNYTKHKRLPNLPNLPGLHFKRDILQGKANRPYKQLHINTLPYESKE